MLDASIIGKTLRSLDLQFYSGVPCSFLKGLINYAINDGNYIAAANEGDAVAICAGAYLGGKPAIVLMQNSGLSNAVSPLTSLNAIFQIPVLGFVSLRGEEGIQDEPQHQLMGKITTQLLDLMKIKWEYLSDDAEIARGQLAVAKRYIDERKTFFFVVKKNTFQESILNAEASTRPVARRVPSRASSKHVEPLPSRIEAIRALNASRDSETIVIATTGFTGRELYQCGDLPTNFYMVGSMGCASTMALGLALAQPQRKIICIDGDGAALMRMGALATIAFYTPPNLFHLLLDNGIYESTGSQPSVSPNVDWAGVALAAGYPQAYELTGLRELSQHFGEWQREPNLTFASLKIRPGSPEKLLRPTVTPSEVATRLRDFLNPQLSPGLHE